MNELQKLFSCLKRVSLPDVTLLVGVNKYLITRTSECLISLGRTYELCLCRDISSVRRTSEIALHKKSSCVLQPRLIKHELVLVFIPYYPIIK